DTRPPDVANRWRFAGPLAGKHQDRHTDEKHASQAQPGQVHPETVLSPHDPPSTICHCANGLSGSVTGVVGGNRILRYSEHLPGHDQAIRSSVKHPRPTLRAAWDA